MRSSLLTLILYLKQHGILYVQLGCKEEREIERRGGSRVNKAAQHRQARRSLKYLTQEAFE